MLEIFEKIADVQERLEKVAVLGAAAGAFARVGGAVFKNPLKTVGAAASGYELKQGFKKGTDLAKSTKDIVKTQSKMAPKINNTF